MPVRFIVEQTNPPTPPQEGDTDSSPVGNIFTPVSMVYSTDSKFGISSANFTGSNYMTTTIKTDLVLELIWTVRCWIKPQTAAQQYFLQYNSYSESEGGPKPGGYTLGMNNSGGIYFYYASDGVDGHLTGYKNTSTNLIDGNWHHIEFVRNGLNFYFFIDGQNQGSNDATNPSATEIMGTPELPFSLGRGSTGSFAYEGKIDEVEIIKGVALHTSNFLLPSEASVATANHVLLMHMDDDGAV